MKIPEAAFFSYYFANRTLRELVLVCPWFIADHDCIITCLDSNPDTTGPVATALSMSPGSGRVGMKQVVDGGALLAFAAELFDGFDELYVVVQGSWRNLDSSIWRGHW